MIELVLLGDPVEHSRSPALHTAALLAAGLEGRYSARTVNPQGMAAAAEELRAGVLTGANVTMPHKRVAAELSDELDQAAQRSGSVNTWVMRGAALTGYSTDGQGVRFAWQAGGLPTEGPVLVLGTGGAAAAALVELENRQLFVSGRRFEAAVALIDRLDIDAHPVPWGTTVTGATLVNATPIGMGSERLPEGVVEAAAGLLDMTYGPRVSQAVTTAGLSGIPSANGLDMLIGQAMASFELWTGVPADEAAMRAVAV